MSMSSKNLDINVSTVNFDLDTPVPDIFTFSTISFEFPNNGNEDIQPYEEELSINDKYDEYTDLNLIIKRESIKKDGGSPTINIQIQLKNTDPDYQHMNKQTIEQYIDALQALQELEDFTGIDEVDEQFKQEIRACHATLVRIDENQKKLEAEYQRMNTIMNEIDQYITNLPKEIKKATSQEIEKIPKQLQTFEFKLDSAIGALMSELNEHSELGSDTHSVKLIQDYYAKIKDFRQNCNHRLDVIFDDHVFLENKKMFKFFDMDELNRIKSENSNDPIKVFVLMQKYMDIMSMLEKADLLNEKNAKKLFNYASHTKNPNDEIDQLLSLYAKLEPISKVELLVQSNLDAFLERRFIDKTCQTRIGGMGGQLQKNQINWGYYCNGAETNILEMIEKNQSLETIFDYAAKVRNAIARYEKDVNADKFGNFRVGQGASDIYFADPEVKSVANAALFPSLLKVVQDLYKPQQPSNQRLFVKKMHVDIDTTVKDNICQLAPSNIRVGFKEDQKTNTTTIDCILTSSEKYNSKDEVRRRIRTLDDAFFTKLKDKNLNQEDYLKNLGELTHYLTRLYPFERGSGAIIQWIIRSLINYRFEKDIGDFKLGEKKDIPFDIYAHLVKDKNIYTEEFTKAMNAWINPKPEAEPGPCNIM